MRTRFPGFRQHFNSRPSARGDERLLWTDLLRKRISIHAPPRGATRNGRAAASMMVDFNSRPSARGDGELAVWVDKDLFISIHAPPRGATAHLAETLKAEYISIHAPPRGATAKDMQFLQIFCSTLTNQHGLTIVPRNLSRLFW